MGFVRRLTGAEQAKEASQVQAEGGRQAIDTLREQAELARADLAPFRELGESRIASFSSLLDDPTGSSPLADAAVGESMRRVEERRAAGGKLNSGGTLVDLTNATAMTRDALLNSAVNRELAALGIGVNAASGSANVAQSLGAQVAGINQGVANTTAAGIVGAGNANRQFMGGVARKAGGFLTMGPLGLLL